jgi:hypothetical protein
VVALSDRRAVLLGRRQHVPVPDDALFAGRLETALAACVPSTVALTAFSLIALLVEPTLAALLAGGMQGSGSPASSPGSGSCYGSVRSGSSCISPPGHGWCTAARRRR